MSKASLVKDKNIRHGIYLLRVLTVCMKFFFKGRGTSMLDGLSIAWSVIEHLHTSIQCRTLASTHYYQLAKLAHILPRVDSYHVTAKHSKDGLSFTYKVTVM